MKIDGFVWDDATRELTILAAGDRTTYTLTPALAEALAERLGEQ